MSSQARFIVFEGPDGSGKSTQAQLLASEFEKQGIEAVLVREPGGTEIGEKVRSILLDAENSSMCRRAELLLYMASRAQLVKEIIKPALDRGETVISDRYVYSSFVYQGYAGGLDVEEIKRIGYLATDSLMPDKVFLIDCDAETGLSRISDSKDRMEQKDIEFHKKVRDGYLQAARNFPDVFSIIDGTRRPDTVFQEIKEILNNEF